jgi:hypothetical protein
LFLLGKISSGCDGGGDAMESLEERPRDRRSFLGQLGKTLGLGLGLGLLTSTNAGARTNTCAIWCSPACGSSCSNGSCPGVPACSGNCFYCTTMCGYNYYDCLPNSCSSGFCYATNYC